MTSISLSKKILAASGTIIISFATAVFAYIDSKINDVNRRVDDKYKSAQVYVDVKHSAVEDKLNKIETILIRIEDRVYQLNQRGK